MIPSFGLFLYCLAGAGGYLLVISWFLLFIERKFDLTRTAPPEIVESSGLLWSAVTFVMEALFLVVIPTLAYAALYAIMPVTGVRGGFAVALTAFVLGGMPLTMKLAMRLRLPTSFFMFQVFALLIKTAGCLAIIGYLYAL